MRLSVRPHSFVVLGTPPLHLTEHRGRVSGPILQRGVPAFDRLRGAGQVSGRPSRSLRLVSVCHHSDGALDGPADGPVVGLVLAMQIEHDGHAAGPQITRPRRRASPRSAGRRRSSSSDDPASYPSGLVRKGRSPEGERYSPGYATRRRSGVLFAVPVRRCRPRRPTPQRWGTHRPR